jgi:hypothetical protein
LRIVVNDGRRRRKKKKKKKVPREVALYGTLFQQRGNGLDGQL